MEKIKKAIIVLISMAMCIVGLTSCKGEKIPQNYIDAITEYKSNLKDPASLRIYGNVLVANLKDSENYIISMICDAKNSYGGYGGKDTIEIMISSETDATFVDSESEYFLNIREVYEEWERLSELGQISSEEQAELDDGIVFETFDGEAVAKEVGAEYFPA